MPYLDSRRPTKIDNYVITWFGRTDNFVSERIFDYVIGVPNKKKGREVSVFIVIRKSCQDPKFKRLSDERIVESLTHYLSKV